MQQLFKGHGLEREQGGVYWGLGEEKEGGVITII